MGHLLAAVLRKAHERRVGEGQQIDQGMLQRHQPRARRGQVVRQRRHVGQQGIDERVLDRLGALGRRGGRRHELRQKGAIAQALHAARALADQALADGALLAGEDAQGRAERVGLPERIDVVLEPRQPRRLLVGTEIDVLDVVAHDLRPRKVLRDHEGGVVARVSRFARVAGNEINLHEARLEDVVEPALQVVGGAGQRLAVARHMLLAFAPPLLGRTQVLQPRIDLLQLPGVLEFDVLQLLRIARVEPRLERREPVVQLAALAGVVGRHEGGGQHAEQGERGDDQGSVGVGVHAAVPSVTASPTTAQAASSGITPTLNLNRATAAATAMAAEIPSKRPAKPCGQSTW